MVRLRATFVLAQRSARPGSSPEERTMRKPTAPYPEPHDSSHHQSGLSAEGRNPPRAARTEPALDAHSHRTTYSRVAAHPGSGGTGPLIAGGWQRLTPIGRDPRHSRIERTRELSTIEPECTAVRAAIQCDRPDELRNARGFAQRAMHGHFRTGLWVNREPSSSAACAGYPASRKGASRGT